MALNFANARGYAGGLIPENTLTLAKIEVRELKTSAAGNVYLSIIARVFAGQYEGRVAFGQIMLTENSGTAPAQIGYSQVKSVLECTGLDAKSNPESFAFETFEQVAAALHGAVAGVRIGIEADENKKRVNRVTLFLSPDQSSGTTALWDKMLADIEDHRAATAAQ